MEKLATLIKDAIQNSPIQKYSNVVYQIRNENITEKEELKSLLVQGDSSKYHTVVEIDFSNTPPVRSRRRSKNRHDTEGIYLKILQIDSHGDNYNSHSDNYNSYIDRCVSLRIYNSPIYIYGRYIKMSRNMCQSPLSISGKFKTERNVSDFSDSFGRFFGGVAKFMGCGREDIDVRCLEGRPFIVEISHPTSNLESSQLDVQLYEDVDILDCCVVTRECKDLVNCSEPDKFYNLLVFSLQRIKFPSINDNKYTTDHKVVNTVADDDNLNTSADDTKYTVTNDKLVNTIIRLSQKTPLRVLHRRPNLTREKTIQILDSTEYFYDGYYYNVNIKASSGAYIKEWVNGDFNRTIPNLNSDLLELDVVKVELEIPKEYVIRQLILNK